MARYRAEGIHFGEPEQSAARALYESRGFRAVGLRRAYYSKTNEDAIVMMKELVVS